MCGHIDVRMTSSFYRPFSLHLKKASIHLKAVFQRFGFSVNLNLSYFSVRFQVVRHLPSEVRLFYLPNLLVLLLFGAAHLYS